MKWIYIILSLFSLGCTRDVEKVRVQNEYFTLYKPVKKSLESSKSLISTTSKKIVVYKDNKSIVELDTSSINDVIKAFQQMHINKKAFMGVYKCDTAVDEDEITLSYRLKPEEKSDIESLELYFKNKIEYEKLDSFRVLRRNSNFLYTNEESLRIILEQGRIRKAILSGTQDLILLKNKEYRLEIII